MTRGVPYFLALASAMFTLGAQALASWSFDRVTTSCDDQPREIAYYELMATELHVQIGTSICEDDQGQAYFCPETVRGIPIAFRILPDPGTGTSVSFSEDYVTQPELLPACGPATCVTAWPFFVPVRACDISVPPNCSEACP